MIKPNKLTGGVFTEIVGDTNGSDSYYQFLYGMGRVPSKELKKLNGEYLTLINNHRHVFEKLAKLEEVILQIRSRDTIMKGSTEEIKLSLVRDYIYSRHPFYRKDMKTKDIRVIVDKSEFWGEDLDVLMTIPEFSEKSKTKLIDAMNIQIHETLSKYRNTEKIVEI